MQNHVETSILDAEDRLPGRFSLHRVKNKTTPSIFPASPVTTWCHCGVAIVSSRDTIDDTCTPPFMRSSPSLFNQETAWPLQDHNSGLEEFLFIWRMLLARDSMRQTRRFRNARCSFQPPRAGSYLFIVFRFKLVLMSLETLPKKDAKT